MNTTAPPAAAPNDRGFHQQPADEARPVASFTPALAEAARLQLAPRRFRGSVVNAPRRIRAPSEADLRRLSNALDEAAALRGDNLRRRLIEPSRLERATVIAAWVIAGFFAVFFAWQFFGRA